MRQAGLAGIRVVDFSDQIAGSYRSKLFVDAGAEVIKIESPEGDSLRRWSATGTDLQGEDSAVFTFLNAGQQSVGRAWIIPVEVGRVRFVGSLADERKGEGRIADLPRPG